MYLIQQLEDTDICNSSLQISDSYALPKIMQLLFFLESRAGIHRYEIQQVVIFSVFSKKEFSQMEWQFYRYSSSTSEIIPGMGNELEYVI